MVPGRCIASAPCTRASQGTPYALGVRRLPRVRLFFSLAGSSPPNLPALAPALHCQGPTVAELLAGFPGPRLPPADAPFRMTIQVRFCTPFRFRPPAGSALLGGPAAPALALQAKFEVHGAGTVIAGRVWTGVLRPGMKLTLEPLGATVEAGLGRLWCGVLVLPTSCSGARPLLPLKVESLELFHEAVTEAGPGQHVGALVRRAGPVEGGRIDRGMVARPADPDPNEPRPIVQKITAQARGVLRPASAFPPEHVCHDPRTLQILVINHPSVVTRSLTPIVDAHVSHVPCLIEELVSIIDRKQGKGCLVSQRGRSRLERRTPSVRRHTCRAVATFYQEWGCRCRCAHPRKADMGRALQAGKKPAIALGWSWQMAFRDRSHLSTHVLHAPQLPPLGRLVLRSGNRVVAVGIVKVRVFCVALSASRPLIYRHYDIRRCKVPDEWWPELALAKQRCASLPC